IIDGNPHPAYDVQIALMSLPLIFQTTLETIPCEVPYLQVNSPPLDLPIKPQTKLKIGIVWGANFQHSTSSKRSCPVSYFADLTNMSEVQLFSLQKGSQVADLAEYPEITNVDHLINDLADTANIINQLDLVITVDTAVAHLAGALGKPTWLLLAFAPEWRWLLDRPDSPWYPTMRLFRQPVAKDWQTVFQQISEALFDLMNASGHKVIKTKKRRSSALPEELQVINNIDNTDNTNLPNRPILKSETSIVNNPYKPLLPVKEISHQVINQVDQQLLAQTLFDQAYQANQNSDLSQAIALYKQGLNIQPNALAYNNLGNIYKQQEKYQEAIVCYEAGLKVDSTVAELYYNCGIAWQTIEQRQKAIAQYEQAIKYKPEIVEFHLALALNLQAVGRISDAIAIYQQIIQQQPTTARHYYNIGTAYQNSKQYNEAVTAYEKAIELDPQTTGVYNNLGNTFRSMGRLTEAIATYEQGMQIDPNFAKLYNNKGCTLLDLADPQGAIACFRLSLEKDPNYTEAHSNLGMTLLSTGEWQEGWREYEWRKKFPGYEPPKYPQPVWQGEDLTGKTILLVPEQGFGDNIQFIRYVPELIAKGGRVMVQCYPALQRLWQQIPGIAQILLPSDPIPYFDSHINLMSLPYVCQTTLETIPRQIPYLNIPAELKIALAMSSKSVNIGIVWATNPINITAEKRSCSFSYF
ncbi:MAG: tetratricopeptide repeat protein, partial [Microcoleaceae cyanobacterium]